MARWPHMLSSRYVLRVTLEALASVVFADANDLLIAAIGKGDLEKVRDLIGTGADPNADARGGASVVALASVGGHREIAALLLERGALVQGVANASGVRIRDRATTVGSAIIGGSDRGELVSILAKSRERVAIQGMVAHWYRIQKADSTTGFSYGFFFDVDEREIDVLPTFYENDAYGFRLQLPATWEGLVVSEQIIDF